MDNNFCAIRKKNLNIDIISDYICNCIDHFTKKYTHHDLRTISTMKELYQLKKK